MIQRNKNFVLGIFGVLICLNAIAWLAVFEMNHVKFLEVNFFDVGQGDAIFIETPLGYQILIDGGPDSAILEKLGKEMPFWDRTIDLIILTHPEHDHIAGLIEVLKTYKVEQILWTGVKRDTREYKKWLELIQEESTKQGAKITIARAPQEINLQGSDPCNLQILWPVKNLEGQEVKNTNNTSVIARLVFGENSFLFTGDAYKSVERKLIKAGIFLDSDVLKVGHHGSKTSSSKEFISAVSPEIAVIQCGKDNRYGHPYQETLACLEEYDIKILRTDLDGDIKIISDGINYAISNF
jgi:competence protein ComEC